MIGINKHIIVGHVGRDPEINVGAGGAKVASFSVATTESWRDKNTGDRKESTAWHRVVVFNEKIAAVVESYVRKGSKVYVEGQVLARKYVDKAGIEKTIVETVLKSWRGELQLLDRAEKTTPGDEDSYSRGSAVDDEVPF